MSGVLEVSVVSRRRNVLLDREEYVLLVRHADGTPSRMELLDAIASRLNVDKDSTVIVKIQPNYGSSVCKVTLHSYDSVEKLRKIEPKHILRRNGLLPSEAKVKK